jgi:hypothetical protein
MCVMVGLAGAQGACAAVGTVVAVVKTVAVASWQFLLVMEPTSTAKG